MARDIAHPPTSGRELFWSVIVQLGLSYFLDRGASSGNGSFEFWMRKILSLSATKR